jgi:hypothetical protein
LVVLFLFQSGSLWAQKGKAAPTTTPLTALFRDDGGDKILSDGGGVYYSIPDRYHPNRVELGSDGRLHVEVQGNRRVVLVFDTAARPAPIDPEVGLTCREYVADGGWFHMAPPPFLAGVPNNDFTDIETFGEITYNGTAWVYDPTGPKFNFTTMKVGTAASLVRVQINFGIVESPELFGIMPNYRQWTGEPAGGIVKVTHPSANVWIVEPQSPDDPVVPLRSLGPDESGFKVTAPAVRREHDGGTCDLGDWKMPFRLTLTKR